MRAPRLRDGNEDGGAAVRTGIDRCRSVDLPPDVAGPTEFPRHRVERIDRPEIGTCYERSPRHDRCAGEVTVRRVERPRHLHRSRFLNRWTVRSGAARIRQIMRSEERRVGKECRCWWWRYD